MAPDAKHPVDVKGKLATMCLHVVAKLYEPPSDRCGPDAASRLPRGRHQRLRRPLCPPLPTAGEATPGQLRIQFQLAAQQQSFVAYLGFNCQTAAAAFYIWTFCCCCLTTLAAMYYVFFHTCHQWLVLFYLSWVVFDREVGETGGRTVR